MIKRSITIVGLLAVLILFQGCGTVTGVVSGPLMGGTSLTAKMYQSDASTGIKVVGTPFVFVGGTVIGIFPGLGEGIALDHKVFPINEGPYFRYYTAEAFADLFDPFDAGLFEKEKEKE